ncbi:hypothetical protein C8Q80DRAFT_684273 [Daedaleopsis nitida]|nr:hypothetical protein C8Q80DRAFT_684273 [Daedaleopsis nitida]
MLPAFEWLRKTPGAWLIPIGIMIVLSCPPLFGHELVAVLCGDIWGVWIGFGIVAAGTIFGELFTYYVFRFGCRGRGEKTEKKNLKYALICEVIREGGLPMAVIVRYSTIPPHLTTAIFATAGMHVTTFLMAAFLALPKQLAIVYVGVADGNSNGAPADENLEDIYDSHHCQSRCRDRHCGHHRLRDAVHRPENEHRQGACYICPTEGKVQEPSRGVGDPECRARPSSRCTPATRAGARAPLRSRRVGIGEDVRASHRSRSHRPCIYCLAL